MNDDTTEITPVKKKKLSSSKRVKCLKCNAFIRENQMPKHKCYKFTIAAMDKILVRNKLKDPTTACAD